MTTMKIIDRYLSHEIFKYFGIVLAIVIIIYCAVDFFEKIDNFIEVGFPSSKVFIYFLSKIPFIVAQITPLGILVAVLIVFGLMTKNNEIVALKSGGVSIYCLLRPVVAIGLMITILLFFFSEIIVPVTISKANSIWMSRKAPIIRSQEKNIWIKGNRLIAHIRYYNPAAGSIFGITINYFDKDFRLIRRIDAEKGAFMNGKWVFYDLMEQRLDKATGNYNVYSYKEKAEELDILPQDLKRVVKKAEEMNFLELLAYIKRVEAEGYDATKYRVDLCAKTAMPFVCIIFSILGAGIAAKGKIRKAGMSTGIAFGIGIAFLYWSFYSFCLSLGYGSILPPFIAAWVTNFIFLCFGIFTLLNAE